MTVEDLDLKLESRGIYPCPRNRLPVADARFSQRRIPNAREMVTTQRVPEFVLIPELLIPVRVKEEVIGFCTRPPRFLEVLIQVSVGANEGSADSSAYRLELAGGKGTGRIGQRHRCDARGIHLDSRGDQQR